MRIGIKENDVLSTDNNGITIRSFFYLTLTIRHSYYHYDSDNSMEPFGLRDSI